MTQTMDLNKMGLADMSQLEISKVDGGSFLTSALASLGGIAAGPLGVILIGKAAGNFASGFWNGITGN